MRFFCRTCPYVFQLKSKVTSEATLERKVVDDVLGGPDAWKNADQTEGARALPATTTSCLRPSARLGPTLGSQLRQVRQRPRVLPAAADPLGRRADDDVLLLRRVRAPVEGQWLTPPCVYPLLPLPIQHSAASRADESHGTVHRGGGGDGCSCRRSACTSSSSARTCCLSPPSSSATSLLTSASVASAPASAEAGASCRCRRAAPPASGDGTLARPAAPSPAPGGDLAVRAREAGLLSSPLYQPVSASLRSRASDE